MKPAAEITGYARPYRVAYVLEDGDGVHGWLDAVFSEAVGRHGGRQSLVVPVINQQISNAYLSWLKAFDPDVVLLIAADNARTAEGLRRHCSPLLMQAIDRYPKEAERAPRLSMHETCLTALSWLPFLKVVSGAFRARPETILDA